METLSPALARNAVDRIRATLSPALAKHVDELLGLLQPDGTVKVKTIHENLFALSTTASANASLNRLMAGLNDKLSDAGSSARLQITADKKVGLQRDVWFEAEQTALPRPYTRELDAIDQELLTTDQQATFVDNADFVLLTFNEHELQQALQVFGCEAGKHGLQKEGRLYYRLGVVGGHKVVLLHSAQATIEAMQSTTAAISAWQPKAIIAMGIAFGVDRDKQNIGDVLIAEHLIPYELARVNSDGNMALRGPRPPASKKLFQAFQQLNVHFIATRAVDYPVLRFGGIFTGDKLIDSSAFLSALRKHAPEAIGGEMEGNGLYEAASSAGLDWIVVKAICDFADGTKNTKAKEYDQATAARHAAKVVKALLEQSSLDWHRGNNHSTQKKIENGPEHFSAHRRDLEGNKYTVDDALATQTSLLKSDLLSLGSASSAVSGIPVQQALMKWLNNSDKDVFTLLGEYGMGKTINCQLFDKGLRDAHQQNNALPVSLYFDLRHVESLTDSNIPDIEKVVADCVKHGWFAKEDHSKFTLADVERWARQYGLVLIFDGLDEVLVKLQEKGGQRFTNLLFKLLADLKQRLPEQRIKMLLSCRTQYFPSLNQQIDHFTNSERGGYRTDRLEAMILLPFNEQQIVSYLQHSLPGLDPNKILAMIASVHDLTDLSKRPYTLKLVSELIPQIEKQRQLGKSVSGVGLYQLMIDRWLNRDNGKHHVSPAHKKLLAAHLAAFLWKKGQRSLPADEMQNWFHQWLDEQPSLASRYRHYHPDLLEEDLRTATFLSRLDGDSGSRFQFAHSSLQEFFLASYLLQAVNDNRPELWAMSKPSRETLAFLAQLLAEPENKPLITKLTDWKQVYRPQVSENILYFAMLSPQLGFAPPNLAGISLVGAQLDDLQITVDPTFGVGLSLVNADFSNASLRRASFTKLLLQNAKFNGANLTQASFARCQLNTSCFTGADLTSCMFYRCNLLNVSLATANTLHTQQYYCLPHVGQLLLQSAQRQFELCTAQVKQCITSGYNSRIKTLAVLGDGVTLASAGDDNSIRLWDSRTGACLQELNGHQGWIQALTVLGDGVTLASASIDNSIRLWDSRTGACLQELTSHQGWIQALTVLGDGVTLASAGGRGNSIRLWDSRSGVCLQILSGHQGSIQALTVLGDGVTLASGGEDKSIRLWDSRTGACLQELNSHQGSIQTLTVLGDGVTLASAGLDNGIRLWDSRTGACLQELNSHQGSIQTLTVLGDGVTLASAGRDNGIRLWDSWTGACLQELSGHRGSLQTLTVLGDGVTLASAGLDNSIRLWDSRSGACLQELSGHHGWIQALTVLSDGVTLASAGLYHSIRLWDSRSDACLQELGAYQAWGEALTVLGDGVTLASASIDNSIRLWDSRTGACLQELSDHRSWIQALTVLGDGVTLASGGEGKSIRLWDSRTGACLQELTSHCGWTQALTVLGDGVTLASAGRDNSIRLWDSRSGACLQELNSHQGWIHALTVLGDGVTLAAAGTDSNIRLWDSRTGTCLQELNSHQGSIHALTVLGDGVTLASAGDDSRIRLWDSRTGACLQELRGHRGSIQALTVLGDGVTLASAGRDNSIRLWDCQGAKCLRVLHVLQDRGFVVWDALQHKPLHASDNAWRYLSYLLDFDGKPSSVPFFMPTDNQKAAGEALG
ncbi:NACHT domain-containing protein [Nitrincola sp. MINF-07-Sa-05]|uniref:phosphorylase family protein n=1 Tax=Nitrincola salilacus TaxID=3400273 RepID=UPI0039186087